MTWKMEPPATKISDLLWAASDQKQPHEILKLDEHTAGIVVDIDGTDYMLTMTEMPAQRPRPTNN